MSTRSALDHTVRDLFPGSRPVSPVVRVRHLTDQGMMFESRRLFEVGTFIDLGVHVPREGQRQGGSLSEPSFLCLEGLVVDCQPDLTGRSEAAYRVTVLFSDLGADDRFRLLALGQMMVAAEEARPAAGKKTKTVQQQQSRLSTAEKRLAAALGLN